MWPKKFTFCVDFGMFIPWTTIDFLEASAHVSSKVATDGSLNQKMEGCDRSNSRFWDGFERSILSSTIDFLEVNAHGLLNVATKVLLVLKNPEKLAFFRLLF